MFLPYGMDTSKTRPPFFWGALFWMGQGIAAFFWKMSGESFHKKQKGYDPHMNPDASEIRWSPSASG